MPVEVRQGELHHDFQAKSPHPPNRGALPKVVLAHHIGQIDLLSLDAFPDPDKSPLHLLHLHLEQNISRFELKGLY